jgi:two-component system, NtrC family, nitrogen regulation sensor histidine kinase NtrY
MSENESNRALMQAVRIRSGAIILILLLAIAAAHVYSGNWEYRALTRKAERIVDQKISVLRNQITNLKHDGIDAALLRSESHRVKLAELRKEGITLLVYADSNLVFWSDNAFDVPLAPFTRNRNDKLLFIHNGFFIKEKIESADTVIIGLLRIYSSYDIENRLVRSGFPGFMGLPAQSVLVPTPEVSDYHVNGTEGDYLFSIKFPEVKENSWLLMIPLLFWSLFFLFLLLLIDSLSDMIKARIARWWTVLFKVSVYTAIYYLILRFGMPEVFQRTELFMHSHFAIGRAIPSIGHIFLLSLLFADLARTFYNDFPVRARTTDHSSRLFLGFTLAQLPGTLMMLLLHQVMVEMVSNPNINFEGYRVADLSFLSIAGVTSLFLLVLVPGFYLMKMVKAYQKLGMVPFLLSVGLNLLIFADAGLFGIETGIPLALFFFLTMLLLRLVSENRIGLFNLAALLAIFFSVYGTWYISKISLENERESRRVMAVAYASEHDPVAEYLLLKINESIKSDSLLSEMMMTPDFGREDADRISDYLRDIYFGDYFTNYDFSMVMCSENSLLNINSQENSVSDCFSFFNDRLLREGEIITGTNFNFIDNRTGRPCYLGVFYYPLPEGGTNGLFIELFSFVNAFREGYPELLIDQKYMKAIGPRDYSFAKYIDGNLVLNTGDFRFWTNDREIIDSSQAYHFFEQDGYSHLLYNTGNVSVILSRPVIPFLNSVVSFAWLFIYLISLSTVVALLYQNIPGRNLSNLNFRQKIQAAFVGIILFSFISIAAGAAWLTIEQYRSKHFDSIREKASSVYIELEHKLAEESTLLGGWSDGKYQSLSELLIKFSNVFYTDINLYDHDGMLLATSRPEIFIRDLTSHRMDKLAHLSLSEMAESEYIAWEKTGDLEYLSIYMPFYNSRNELLAYLNIPYFRMQSVLAAEISNLVVAIINFSLLMILATMSLGVFISDRITSPIRMLGDLLASVKLGKRSQRLTYSAEDEIGDLVKQYNRMVEEIEESARKLSASERESAWREMARQVAHEIKNPLTPMKLNVQQLEKSWRDGKPGFEKKLEKFTRNQIENIDSLSSIATAFSSFAQLPPANPTQIDLVEQIMTTLELFKNADRITFRLNTGPAGRIGVYADREHLNSVFSNLIKNAIQAIPPGKQGLIKITLGLDRDVVSVSVSDNGTGIPEDVRNRLFTPYFTTKSSGSGLGLSIVKRFVEGMGGQISFVSDSEQGTTFTLLLPVSYSSERI